MRDAEPGLHRDSRGREGLVGRRGRQHDKVDRLCLDTRIGERRPRRMEGKVGRKLAWRGNMALANPGALDNPFVSRRDRTRQFIVADDARWKIAAAAEYDRTQHGHEPAPLAIRAVVPACRSRAIDWPIFASRS